MLEHESVSAVKAKALNQMKEEVKKPARFCWYVNSCDPKKKLHFIQPWHNFPSLLHIGAAAELESFQLMISLDRSCGGNRSQYIVVDSAN